MKLITFTGTGLFMILSAFTIKNHHGGPAQSATLYDTKWYLTKIHSPADLEVPDGKTAFIKFNRLKNSAGGNGGCNSFGSTTVVNNDKLSIKDIFSTKMFCEGVQKSEDAYLKALGEVNRFETNDKTLYLYHNKVILLEFSKE